MIKDSGERTEFGTGAVRDLHTGKGRMDLLPWEAIIEVSRHCEEGALKYGERNCEKGIPIHSLVDSAFRHLAKYTIGEDDENHLRAAAWNILFALYMEIKHPEMQDIPMILEKRDKDWSAKIVPADTEPEVKVESKPTMDDMIDLICWYCFRHSCHRGRCAIKEICVSCNASFRKDEEACRSAYEIIKEERKND